MKCPKCKKRISCTDTNCYKNVTARRYKCKDCDISLFTLEREASKHEVNYILAKKWGIKNG